MYMYVREMVAEDEDQSREHVLNMVKMKQSFREVENVLTVKGGQKFAGIKDF